MPDQIAAPTGVIHDLGYQRYDGSRLGRWYASRSLYVHGVRAAFGLGRNAKAKIFPWFAIGIITLVAAVVTAVRAQLGRPVMSYAQLPDSMVLLTVLFCAVAAPELVSRDLRSGVLPLYFSRPLGRGDYALAKLASLASAVWLALAGPQLLMFAGGAFSVTGWPAIRHEIGQFVPALGYSAIYAAVFASIALLVASLASRRAVAAAVIVAVFLVTLPVAGVLTVLGTGPARDLAGLVSPMTLLSGIGTWLFHLSGPGVGRFGWVYGSTALALVALATGLLLARYRRVAR